MISITISIWTELLRSLIKNKKSGHYKFMDLDLDNVFEIKEIRKLISHEKKLLEFFDELIKLKNITINDSSDYESESESDYDSSSSE